MGQVPEESKSADLESILASGFCLSYSTNEPNRRAGSYVKPLSNDNITNLYLNARELEGVDWQLSLMMYGMVAESLEKSISSGKLKPQKKLEAFRLMQDCYSKLIAGCAELLVFGDQFNSPADVAWSPSIYETEANLVYYTQKLNEISRRMGKYI